MKHDPTPEHAALLILNAVSAHERQLGVGRLALLLKGSKDKRVFADYNSSELAESTVWQHLIDAVKLGKLKSEDVVGCNRTARIREAAAKLNNARLKEFKAQLPEDFTYNEIRCVLAETVR